MIPRRAFAGLLVVAALALASPATLLSQTTERTLYVSVLDRSGAPVPNLGAPDFVVREDGVAREVLRAAPAVEPMQVAILLSGLGGVGNIAQLRRALATFVDAMTAPSAAPAPGTANRLAIVAQTEHPTIVVDFTSDRVRLQQAVQSVWTQGRNCALDGVIEVVRGLEKRDAARRVIVAITTEAPEPCATHNAEQVLIPLREAGAAFHAIIVGPLSQDTGDDARLFDTVLTEGSQSTGGSHDQSLTGLALAGKLQRLADVLTHQYEVTYARPESFLPPQRVTVGTKNPDLTARGTLVASPRRRP